MNIRRCLRHGACLLAVTIALPAHASASAGDSPTLYVADAEGLRIIKAGKMTQIAGRNTKLTSPWSIERQRLGDLVVANREISHSHIPGRIVTLPPGEGNVPAKYVLKCKDFTPGDIALDKDSNIWMTDYDSNDVRAYPATANGCPAPLVTIRGPHTQLDQPEAVAIDSKGRIIVANYLSGIAIYAADANGDAAPIATIEGAETRNAHIEGLAVDSHDNLWVTSYANAAVYEFAPDARGAASPIRMLAGSLTQFSAPIGLAIDRKSGDIYVADYGTRAILEFAPDAQGNAAPIATITGPTFPWDVALH
jgi:DNA-binding beta-propeller fold protein YncE